MRLRTFLLILTVFGSSMIHGATVTIYNELPKTSDINENSIMIIITWNPFSSLNTERITLKPLEYKVLTNSRATPTQQGFIGIVVLRDPLQKRNVVRFKVKDKQQYEISLKNGDFSVTSQGKPVFLFGFSETQSEQ